MKMYKFPLLILLALLASCSKIHILDHSVLEKDDFEMSNLVFSDDYKNFQVDIKIKEDFSPTSLGEVNKLKVVAKELHVDMKELVDEVQPQFVRLESLKASNVKQMGLTGMVLVDLTLGEVQVEQQRKAVSNLRTLFADNNLYLSFMKGNSISETYPATDYVMENYFVADSSTKQLYRSILFKVDEMNGNASVAYYPSVKTNELWKSIPDSLKFMVVFSDGQTYQENAPIDNAHFELQQKLVQTEKSLTQYPLYYVNFQGDSEEAYDVENEAENIMTYLCDRTGGQYMSSFSWVKMSKAILKGKMEQSADFRLEFSNPDRKVYRGVKRWLRIDVYNGDSLFVTGHKAYAIGSVYHPIIVNGESEWRIIVRVMIAFVCILILLYLVLQFFIPFVRYKLFKRKFVARYVGKNMSLNDIQVGETCYFCKAPFQVGEEIVVKCEHSMHKSCWDENEYKCPEYGRHCKEGSHYYNYHRLYDPKNAPYYMKWLFAGAFAGVFSWLFFVRNNWQIGYDSLVQFIFKLFEVNPNSEMAMNLVDSLSNEFYYSPYFGLSICFFLTLFLSVLSSHGHWWWKRLTFVLLKALLAGFCGYATFVLAAIISLSLGIGGNKLLIDWIPWTLNGYFIAFAVSYQTDIKLRKALIGATISILFGLGSMYIWNLAQNSHTDTRHFLLTSNLIYSMGIAISLAIHSPRSERYFLRIEGPVKMMDVAIYKWMNAQVCNRKITIGKSVDCNLQMTWDINSVIAPIQAKVISERGNIYLIPLEPGVKLGNKMAKVDSKFRLHHGDKFTIGQTLFTYIEKDV